MHSHRPLDGGETRGPGCFHVCMCTTVHVRSSSGGDDGAGKHNVTQVSLNRH